MKKILLILLTTLGLVLMSSCTNEVEEVFDTTASQRLEQHMLECQRLLTSAEHGWQIQYYPSEQRNYGGSVYAAKFEADGSVTVGGDIALLLADDVTETVTSHYSINSSSSVILTFDTYNKYIHYWSDPDDWSENYFDGDFEFAYVSGDETEMVFRGIKTGNRIVFTALDESIETSVSQIAATATSVVENLYLGFRWSVDGAASEIVLYDDDVYNLFTYYPDGDLTGAYETFPYAFSAEGMSFYEAVTIGGVTVRNFRWESGAGRFVSTDAVNASGAEVTVTLTGFHNDDFMNIANYVGTYTLLYNGNQTTVTLTEAPTTLTYKNRSLILSGSIRGFSFDMEVTYSKADGSLSLCSQYVGRYGQYYAWLCPWDAGAGYLTWDTSIGFRIEHNGDPDNLVLTFGDNGVWGSYEANSILFRAFTSMAASSSTVAGNILQVPYLDTMTKQ